MTAQNGMVQIAQKAQKIRAGLQQVLEAKVFPHQLVAAQHAFDGLEGDTRAVILAAEMQSGKSGVALAIGCMQRLSQPDEVVASYHRLKDTLFIMTMADTALLEQAQGDLQPAANVVVTNLTQFEKVVDKEFQHAAPSLIIVDECHYGSGDKSVRYAKLFDYLEQDNRDCKLVFISATPLSALLATEGDSLIRRKMKTRIVFHRASDDYYGVRQMLAAGQVVALHGSARNFLNRSGERTRFLEQFSAHKGGGWALVRVGSGRAMDTKRWFVRQGINQANIAILGQNLAGVPAEQHTRIEDFKKRYAAAEGFDEKFIVITVAGCRAGINFGNTMKSELIATWDSTITNVAAVVQANIGRACGYHASTTALHFTHAPAVRAYAEVLDFLEANCTQVASDDLEGLREHYEKICRKYEVGGLDVGASISSSKRKTIKQDERVYLSDSYLAVPGRLYDPHADFSDYTEDPDLLTAINAIRQVYLGDGPPTVRSNRSVRGIKWLTAGWVNGDTYDNKEKAAATGTTMQRALNLTGALKNDRNYPFNDVIEAGGKVDSEAKTHAALIFSIYNASRRRDAKRHCMSLEEVQELCSWLDVPDDDTLILIAVRGELDEVLTEQRRQDSLRKYSGSSVNMHTHFD